MSTAEAFFILILISLALALIPLSDWLRIVRWPFRAVSILCAYIADALTAMIQVSE